jgi:hypothetical protein
MDSLSFLNMGSATLSVCHHGRSSEREHRFHHYASSSQASHRVASKEFTEFQRTLLVIICIIGDDDRGDPEELFCVSVQCISLKGASWRRSCSSLRSSDHTAHTLRTRKTADGSDLLLLKIVGPYADISHMLGHVRSDRPHL